MSNNDEMNERVLKQLAVVRENGAVNMHDRVAVRHMASTLSLPELYRFLGRASNDEYMAHLREMGRRLEA